MTVISQKSKKDYTKKRNAYKNALIKAESDYTQNEIYINQNDPKKMWRVMKSLYSENKQSRLKVLKFDEIVETDPSVIAEKYNLFAISSIKEICDKIPTTCDKNVIENMPLYNSTFTLKEVEEKEVIKIVNDMKRKSHIDLITGRVLNDAMLSENFRKNFCNMINFSLKNGCVPKQFKISTVVPIPKVKNSIKCEDKRPINKLPICDKILEKIVKNQIDEYLENNQILNEKQSGFRKKHSCETSLNCELLSWKQHIENNKIVILVSLDLKRAFETIDRDLFVKKCARYGFDENAIKWFKSYLSDRT